MASEAMRWTIVFLALLTAIPCSAGAQALSFNGVDGSSGFSEVHEQFPLAVERNYCRETGQILQRSAEGPYRCQQLHVEGYDLGGYGFEISFIFYESGALKQAILQWPRVNGSEEVTDAAIGAAYTATLHLIVSKYGRYVSQPPCELARRRCAEWQIDGLEEWHAGGERIRLSANTDLGMFDGISLVYEFADRRSFDRF